jgi:hypothetical protein
VSRFSYFKLTGGADIMSKNTISVELESVDSSDMGDNAPLLLSDLLATLVKVRDSAPEEFRDKVTVRFYGEGGYLHCEYNRPETDDERQAREARDAAAEGQRKIEKLRLTQRLAAELGMKLVEK